MAGKIQTLIGNALRKPERGFFGWYVTKRVFLKRNVFLEENAAKLCNIEPHHKVLEVGFGPGVGLQAAYQYVKDGKGKIYGVDFSKKMINVANKRLKKEIEKDKVCILEGNVMRLPFNDDKFDRLFHCNCFYFWPDLHAGCRELYRVMRPGSYMVTTMNINSINQSKTTFLKDANLDQVTYINTLKEVGFKHVRTENLVFNDMEYLAMFAYVEFK